MMNELEIEGKKAPAFALAGSDGTTHALGDYAGKLVVLYFYPKDDTPGCTKEACGFRDRHEQLQQLDAVVLGVSKDDISSHENFISKFELPFVLLSDPDATVMQTYGAWGEKTQYGKTSMGVIRSTVLIGTDGNVLKHWRRVAQADQHPKQVMDFIQSL